MRADHPVLRVDGRAGHRKPKTGKRRSTVQPKTLTLETYAQLSHVLCSPTGTGPGLVDELLA